jgi:uncharacterized RDD family membrane protein YckC
MNRAGFGTRVLNFIVDTLVISGISYGINKWWDFQVMFWKYTFIPPYVFFWSVMFVYYTVFEAIFNRSPAKWLSISKVENRNGGKPAFWQILVRSLIRLTIIDCFFIPFLDKPLHDYLSRTEVVEA